MELCKQDIFQLVRCHFHKFLIKYQRERIPKVEPIILRSDSVDRYLILPSSALFKLYCSLSEKSHGGFNRGCLKKKSGLNRVFSKNKQRKNKFQCFVLLKFGDFDRVA